MYLYNKLPGSDRPAQPRSQFVSKLQKIPTKDVIPTSQVNGLENVYREDEIDKSRMLTQEDALANAPATHNGFFKVKAVFGE